jgi:lipopolysaccharide/colanic/teichoic acid biosynthesis glycosyltransferase
MIKRLFDLFWSAAGLFLLAPVLIGLSLAIKITSPGPLFYRGERIGLKGRPFRIYKFRTMVVDADKIGGSSTPEDDPRVTRVGKFLRKYKLDELPQLLNVLSGEMSLVGPRPQVAWAVEKYTSEERAVLDVQPGITDWASLKFANEGEILKGSADPDRDYWEKIHPEKMSLALDYARNHTLLMDIRIIVATISKVFR